MTVDTISLWNGKLLHSDSAQEMKCAGMYGDHFLHPLPIPWPHPHPRRLSFSGNAAIVVYVVSFHLPQKHENLEKLELVN